MATHVITVNGIARRARLQSPVIDAVAQDPHTLTADFISIDASFRPEKFQEIIWTENGTRIFGGIILAAKEVKLGDSTWAGIVTKIQASDFNHYAIRRVVFEDFPSQTLKARLTSLVGTYLAAAPFSVTLHASQVTGPTLPARSYKGKKLVEVFDETVTLASTPNGSDDYLWRIDYNKVLRAIVIGSEAAPFNITDGDGNVLSDLTVDDGATDSYANRIYAAGGVVQEDVHTEHFTGDGTTVTFTPSWQILNTYGYLTVDGVGEGVSPFPAPGPLSAVWYFDQAANSLTDQGGYVTEYRTFPAAIGADIAIIFKGQSYPVESATDAGGLAAYGPWEDVISPSNVGDDSSTLEDFAEAELSKRKDLPRTLTYPTLSLGLAVGQTQSVTNSQRNLSGLSCTITALETRQDAKDLITRTVTLTESTKVRKDYHELLDRWLGTPQATDPGIATVPSTASVGGPSPPVRSVQFNRSGVFGGIDRFLVDEFAAEDDFGVPIRPALVAIGKDSDADNVDVQLAIFNRANGLGEALTFWQADSPSGPNTALEDNFIEAKGAVNLSSTENKLILEALTGMSISPGAHASGYKTLHPGLMALAAMLGRTRRLTATVTQDDQATVSILPDFFLYHDSASNHSYNLLALASSANTVTASIAGPGVLTTYGRVLILQNGSAGGTLTIDPNSTETIGGASTLVLGPDQFAIIQAWNNSGTGGTADWHVILSGSTTAGTAASAGSPGDVQYDNSGVLAAEANFNYDAAGNRLHLTADHTDYGTGTVLTVYGSPGDVTPANDLAFFDLEPGTDAAVTMGVGKNAKALYHYPVFSLAASGTHPQVALNYFDTGSITEAGATVTDAVNVFIAGAPGDGDLGGANYALYIAAGSSYMPFLITEVHEFPEQGSPPASPPSNTAILYAEDNGAGKTRIMAKFSDGSTAQVAIQP